MKFYHWTSKDKREQIQWEWILRWIREVEWMHPSRCTYLAVDKNEAKHYWEVVLEVEYDVNKHPEENNYCEWCWQVRVYEPIQMENIKVLDE